MPCQKILLSTTLFYDVSVYCRSFCWLRSLIDKVFVIIFCNFSIVDVVVILLLHLSFSYARFFFFLPRSSFYNFSFFLFHFFQWSSFFCCCIVSPTMPYQKIPLDSFSCPSMILFPLMLSFLMFLMILQHLLNFSITIFIFDALFIMLLLLFLHCRFFFFIVIFRLVLSVLFKQYYSIYY